jgi:hypothetical protein
MWRLFELCRDATTIDLPSRKDVKGMTKSFFRLRAE